MKTAINTKTKAEFIAVLAIFQEKGWTWFNNVKPLKSINNWNRYEGVICIEFEDKFAYGGEEYFKRNDYKIISFDEFMEIQDKKICPNCGHILEEE